MKKRIFSLLIPITLFIFTVVPAFAAETGVYVKDDQGSTTYYSPEYLSTLSTQEKVAILQNINNNPDDALVVIGKKYQKFNNYQGLSTLVEGADEVIPEVVFDEEQQININPVTGEEVATDSLDVTFQMLEDNIPFLDLDKYKLEVTVSSDVIIVLQFNTDKGSPEPASADVIDGKVSIDEFYTDKDATLLTITALDIMGNEVEIAKSEFDIVDMGVGIEEDFEVADIY